MCVYTISLGKFDLSIHHKPSCPSLASGHITCSTNVRCPADLTGTQRSGMDGAPGTIGQRHSRPILPAAAQPKPKALPWTVQLASKFSDAHRASLEDACCCFRDPNQQGSFTSDGVKYSPRIWCVRCWCGVFAECCLHGDDAVRAVCLVMVRCFH